MKAVFPDTISVFLIMIFFRNIIIGGRRFSLSESLSLKYLTNRYGLEKLGKLILVGKVVRYIEKWKITCNICN